MNADNALALTARFATNWKSKRAKRNTKSLKLNKKKKKKTDWTAQQQSQETHGHTLDLLCNTHAMDFSSCPVMCVARLLLRRAATTTTTSWSCCFFRMFCRITFDWATFSIDPPAPQSSLAAAAATTAFVAFVLIFFFWIYFVVGLCTVTSRTIARFPTVAQLVQQNAIVHWTASHVLVAQFSLSFESLRHFCTSWPDLTKCLKEDLSLSLSLSLQVNVRARPF